MSSLSSPSLPRKKKTMPLLRVQLRSEYGLAQAELYGKVDSEDPNSLLQGIAVAGLVGILTQLGDLAEFAAEVFDGLHEHVVKTVLRSRNLMIRVRDVEAALPLVEKGVLAQTSHIHLAYTAGCEWHPLLQNEQNHLLSINFPCFMMDSYEECCDPPRLHLLDRFDCGGPGSCLKRYSDPTFFKRSSATFDKAYPSNVRREKKAYKTTRRRSLRQNGEMLNGISQSHLSGRTQVSFVENGKSSSTQSASTVETMGRKAQILDHKTASTCTSESSDMDIVKSNLIVRNLRNKCEMDAFSDMTIDQLQSKSNRTDEAESEPDNYEDALNTVESESENGFDYTKIQESCAQDCPKNDEYDEYFINRFQKMKLTHEQNDEQFELSYPAESLPLSPKLEHMKISFHPITNFKTCHLKSEFPCLIESYHNIETAFPSFQLVPEQIGFMNEICGDFDYDAFSRSSPYTSDDCHSQHSEMNSKQWESEECLQLYDALGGVS